MRRTPHQAAWEILEAWKRWREISKKDDKPSWSKASATFTIAATIHVVELARTLVRAERATGELLRSIDEHNGSDIPKWVRDEVRRIRRFFDRVKP